MELWSEIIFNSNFEEHILDKEKQVVVQEINQTLDNPSKVAHHKMSQMLYGGTGLANITLGTVESINNISRQNLLDFRDKHYNSNNCIVSITGDFTGNEVKSLVEEYIEPKISKHGKLSGYTEEVKSNKGKRADLYIDKIQTNGLLCFKIPTYYEPDNEKIWMINRILGAGMASRLFNKIRQQGLAYSIGSTTYDTINNSKLEVYFKTSKEKLDTTISEIKKVIEDVRQNGVTQEEFDDEKRKSIEACFMNQDEPNSRLGYYLMNNKLYDPQERIKEIMKLEKTDCERAFREHIDTNNVYEVYVGPHAEQKATKEDAHTEL